MAANLADIEARAQRQLDGFRTNPDLLARNVVSLVTLVRLLSAQLNSPGSKAESKRDPAVDELLTLFGMK